MNAGQQLLAHINLASGEMRTEVIDQPGQIASAPNAGGAGDPATGGLPVSPGAGASQPMNPARVAQQAQNLPLPERMALPALLGNSAHQEQIQAEMNGQDQSQAKPKMSPLQAQQAWLAQHGGNYFMLIPGTERLRPDFREAAGIAHHHAQRNEGAAGKIRARTAT